MAHVRFLVATVHGVAESDTTERLHSLSFLIETLFLFVMEVELIYMHVCKVTSVISNSL